MIDLDECELLKEGSHGFVYKLSEKYVIKVAKNWGDMKVPDEFLRNEYCIAEELYQKKISAPKPYGIHSCNHRGEEVPGFLMEYIPGKVIQLRVFAITPSSRNLKKEIHKAEDAGFIIPEEKGTKNGIISSIDGRIHLFDFWGWQYKPN